jgi:DNA-binding NarL/FixJ family response regulator
LLAKGNANKDIANRLELSLYTVETIHGKISVKSVTERVLSGVRRGLVT